MGKPTATPLPSIFRGLNTLRAAAIPQSGNIPHCGVCILPGGLLFNRERSFLLNKKPPSSYLKTFRHKGEGIFLTVPPYFISALQQRPLRVRESSLYPGAVMGAPIAACGEYAPVGARLRDHLPLTSLCFLSPAEALCIISVNVLFSSLPLSFFCLPV